MSANKKPRKKYKPKPKMLNPLHYVLTGMKPMTQEQIRNTLIQCHEAQTAMVRGTATDFDYEVLKNAVNVSAAFSATLFDKAYLDDIHEAMVALANCGYRKVKHGKYGYSGTDLQLVNTALHIYEAQIEQATMHEIGQALQVVERAIQQKNFVARITKEGVVDERAKQTELPHMGPHEPSQTGRRLVGSERAAAAS